MLILSEASCVNTSQRSRASPRVTYSTAARLKAGESARERRGTWVPLPLSVRTPEGTVGERLPSSSGASAQATLLFFGCLIWLPRGQAGENPREECVVAVFWQGDARARVCSWTFGVVERFWLLACLQGGLASACAVAVLQGAVMNKQLDKLLAFYFPPPPPPVSECWYCNACPQIALANIRKWLGKMMRRFINAFNWPQTYFYKNGNSLPIFCIAFWFRVGVYDITQNYFSRAVLPFFLLQRSKNLELWSFPSCCVGAFGCVCMWGGESRLAGRILFYHVF